MKIPFTNIEIDFGGRTKQPIRPSGEKFPTSQDTVVEVDFGKTYTGGDLPVKGGRISHPDSITLFDGLISEFAAVQPDYPIEFVKLMVNLATYNSDVSYAVSNIIQLGNTKHKIYFDDKIPAATQKKMTALLATNEKKIYRGGINSLINDLLAQLAITGAVSAEIVANERLDDVRKAILVNPINIKFIYDKENDDYIPFQQITSGMGVVPKGMVQLNENTYKYYPLQRFSEKPYAIPPFLAALESIEVERPMMKNMKNIVQKVGAFGFLSILVNAPQKKQNEDDAVFKTRCLGYLNSVYAETEKGFNKGLVIGFKDTHDFKMQGSANNVEGAKELFNLISEMKMAGLKQDPLMLGRNFNVAETMARVILAKLSTQITNYQKAVANFLEDLYTVRLLLNGFPTDGLTVEFEAPMISDRAKEEEAYGKRIDNLKKLYDMGIIDQQQVAEEAEYDNPAEEQPRVVATPPAAGGDPANKDNKADPTATGDVTDPKTTDQNNIKLDIAYLEAELGKSETEYPYAVTQRYDRFRMSLMWEFDDKLMDKAFRKYFSETNEVFDDAVAKTVKGIAKELATLEAGYTSSQVVDNIMFQLYKEWGKNFTTKQKKVIAKNIKDSYTAMRKADEYFAGMQTVPEAVFGLADIRAVEYFKTSDTYYLGKFITDEDVKSKITKYIKENYLENGMPIGNDAKALAKFEAEFGDVLKLQQWKLEQIISTTVNKMRNTAAVNYLSQAQVTKYRIVGIPDSLQSDFCKNINGKEFDVQTTMDAMQSQFSSDPSQISQVSPFGVSLIDANKLKATPADELQALGIGTPPYHPKCRTRIVAVL